MEEHPSKGMLQVIFGIELALAIATLAIVGLSRSTSTIFFLPLLFSLYYSWISKHLLSLSIYFYISTLLGLYAILLLFKVFWQPGSSSKTAMLILKSVQALFRSVVAVMILCKLYPQAEVEPRRRQAPAAMAQDDRFPGEGRTFND